MKFITSGSKENPVIIMLTGSFCPGECLEYLYERMSEDYYIIIPTYNGHHENSKAFTTRKNEAAEIKKYIKSRNIKEIRMIYGQSMGGEIGIELISQLVQEGIIVNNAFFDGAPCIKLSKIYKKFMHIKFKTMINMAMKKNIDEIVNMKFISKFTNGDTESLRSMIEDLAAVAPYLTEESIRNVNECCYTFDFPPIDEDMQKRIFFFYAKEEKAYKTCYKYVIKAYPHSQYRVESGYGHMTFSVKKTDEYIMLLKSLCEAGR